MKTLSFALVPLFLVTACQTASKVEPVAARTAFPASIEEAVASDLRSSENRKRDIYRRPIETLHFFGLQPNMTVVEISPGGGWYMEILAPLLHANGQYIAALPKSSGGELAKLNDKVSQWIKGHPELAPQIKLATMAPPTDLVADGSADMVLTFRNVHNWLKAGTAQAQFNAFFKALKAGGILGVVEHRANAKSKPDPKAKSGYVREADVIRLATMAGFRLDAKSEMNANSKDTKNYSEGVWTLPPTLTLEDQDRAKYLAIGESDRMTLRFVKPAGQ